MELFLGLLAVYFLIGLCVSYFNYMDVDRNPAPDVCLARGVFWPVVAYKNIMKD